MVFVLRWWRCVIPPAYPLRSMRIIQSRKKEKSHYQRQISSTIIAGVSPLGGMGGERCQSHWYSNICRKNLGEIYFCHFSQSLGWPLRKTGKWFWDKTIFQPHLFTTFVEDQRNTQWSYTRKWGTGTPYTFLTSYFFEKEAFLCFFLVKLIEVELNSLFIDLCFSFHRIYSWPSLSLFACLFSG